MATRINDNRIGVRDSQNKVTQWPTHFANGGFWSRMGNPTPTTCYFGKEQRYFYVLPIGLAAITTELRTELENIVALADAPAIPVVPVVEPVVALPQQPTANEPVEVVPTNVEVTNEPTDSLFEEPKKRFGKKPAKELE